MSSPTDGVRRSTRSRSKPESIYKDFDKAQEEASASKKTRKRKVPVVEEEHEEDEERQNSEDEEEEIMSSDEESSDDDDDDEEDFVATTTRKRKSPSPRKPSPAVKTRKIQVQRRGTKKKKTPKEPSDSSSNHPTRKAVHTALTVLSKKVLTENETPETSLVAALLRSYQTPQDDNADENNTHKRQRRSNNNNNESLYTAQLQTIAKRVMELHHTDPNRAHIDLFNLIFRSVGGTVDSCLSPDDQDDNLEDYNDEELAMVCSNVMEDMELTPVDSVLLCAHPDGAVVEAAEHGGTTGTGSSTKGSLGVREYRKIYKEFWYQLGAVILSDGASAILNNSGNKNKVDSGKSSDTSDSSDMDVDDDESQPQELSSLKFQVEMVREILHRLLDLVNVTVQDIRAASTIAVYELCVALLDRTVELKSKLDVANRQLATAKRSKQHRKKEALTAQIDSWKRAVLDMEGTTEKTAIAIFSKRYRDTNEHIRAESIQLLSRFSLIRPDKYLQNSFLKYFGWLLSDKSAHVRQCALQALLAPFRRDKRKNNNAASSLAIDTSCMSSVLDKFMDRLVDCVNDVDAQVQQVAIELFLVLLKKGFLDAVEDDDVWEKINVRAIAPEASPTLRYNAFLFVLEQLDAFDDSAPASSDAAARIRGIVDWIAHNISDSQIPLEHVRYELTDLIVTSLRASPEHRHLASNWSAMLRVLDTDDSASVDDDDEDDEKQTSREIEAVRKRVLLRFLVCAAEMEVSALSSQGGANLDKDLVEARKSAQEPLPGPKPKKKPKTDASSAEHEELTLALLGALPSLLTSYKTETAVLQSLTSLPQYFLPSVFNLSSRRRDFQLLIKRLSEVFQESTDSVVLSNCVLALTSLAKGEHSRTADAQICLKKTVRTLQDRLLQLFEVKAGLVDSNKNDDDDGDGDDDNDSPADTEHSISLCLRRLSLLSKRVYIGALLVDSTDTGAQDQAVDNLFNMVAEHVAKELNCRKLVYKDGEDEGDSAEAEVASVWEDEKNARVHEMVAEAVAEALSFLLCTAAWRLNAAVETEETPASRAEAKEHIVVRMRSTLLKLTALCFEQFLGDKDGLSFSKEHIAFSEAVQKHAGLISGDMRSLFPKAWSSSSSSLLSACALVDDGALVGGFVRFMRSQESKLRECEESENAASLPAQELLLPLARGLSSNWKVGNRREAGSALAHILGSGTEANRVVTSMSRVLKKVDSTRLLEAHMASLRQSFEDWLDSEPEDPPESQRQSDEEVDELLEAEKAHKEKFAAMEHQAARLSSTLGVGKLNGKMGAPVLFGFIREGVRFAFSTDEPGTEEEATVGLRLAFLRVLSKYLSWIRRHKGSKQALLEFFNHKEAQLRDDPGFKDVLDEDKEALEVFRKAGDLGAFFVDESQSVGSVNSAGSNSDTDNDDEHTDPGLPVRPRSQRPRMSMASSVSSIRSKMSAQSSLSPLVEGSGESSENESPSPTNRRKLSSNSAQFSVSTAGRTRDSVQEGRSDEEESASEQSGSESPSPKKRRAISSSSAQFSVSTAGRTHDTIREEESGEGESPSEQSAGGESPSPMKPHSRTQLSGSTNQEELSGEGSEAHSGDGSEAHTGDGSDSD